MDETRESAREEFFSEMANLDDDERAAMSETAEVERLRSRYAALRRYVLADGCGTNWVEIVEQIESD